MDKFNNFEDLREQAQEEKISVTDKMVGVLSEPSSLFKRLSSMKLKTSNWIIPILLIGIVTAISNFILMGNPEIKADFIEKQISIMESSLQEQVDKGNLSQEKVDELLEEASKSMEETGIRKTILSSIELITLVFIIFFIISGIFYLLIKVALEGKGTYKTAMIAYGLPHYILILQIIIIIILSMTMNKVFMDTSVGSFLNIEKDSFIGLLAHKLDVFSIWFYAVLSIALAKMFKADSTTKYFIMVFGLWIGTSVLWHLLVQTVPLFRMFGM